MSDINTPIQIPSELNVPQPTSDDEETIEQIKSAKSAISARSTLRTPQSADDVQLPKKQFLQLDTKSRSMFNFPTTSRPSNDDDTEPSQEPNKMQIPQITMSPPSTAAFQYSPARNSTGTIDNVNNLTVEQAMRQTSAGSSGSNVSDRERCNSIVEDDGEFDELPVPKNSHNPRLRIRSSIVSMFGRMGKLRRPSIMSQMSTNDDLENGEAKARGPPIRALPQIAATKILRAFSYVGKLFVKRTRNVLKLSFWLRF